ncbi:hypothetical protein HK096_005884 [Nowakowskiella sp. JEL0078]|nr:hypothetical protein HK096_005884 [Nowakowskiella sp. JEL0078]
MLNFCFKCLGVKEAFKGETNRSCTTMASNSQSKAQSLAVGEDPVESAVSELSAVLDKYYSTNPPDDEAEQVQRATQGLLEEAGSFQFSIKNLKNSAERTIEERVVGAIKTTTRDFVSKSETTIKREFEKLINILLDEIRPVFENEPDTSEDDVENLLHKQKTQLQKISKSYIGLISSALDFAIRDAIDTSVSINAQTAYSEMLYTASLSAETKLEARLQTITNEISGIIVSEIGNSLPDVPKRPVTSDIHRTPESAPRPESAHVPSPVSVSAKTEIATPPASGNGGPPPTVPRRPVASTPVEAPIPEPIEEIIALEIVEKIEVEKESTDEINIDHEETIISANETTITTSATISSQNVKEKENVKENTKEKEKEKEKKKGGFKNLFHMSKARPKLPGKKKSENESDSTSVSNSVSNLADDSNKSSSFNKIITNQTQDVSPQLPESQSRPLSPTVSENDTQVSHPPPVPSRRSGHTLSSTEDHLGSENLEDFSSEHESAAESAPLYKRPSGAAAALANAMMAGNRKSTISEEGRASPRDSYVEEAYQEIKSSDTVSSRQSVSFDKYENLYRRSIASSQEEEVVHPPPSTRPRPPVPSPARKSIVSVTSDDSYSESPVFPQRPVRPPPRAPIASSPTVESEEHVLLPAGEETEEQVHEPPVELEEVIQAAPEPPKRIPGVYMAPGHGAISALAAAVTGRTGPPRPMKPAVLQHQDESEAPQTPEDSESEEHHRIPPPRPV